MARCSICHTLIQAQDRMTECPECRQEYHASCWDELGGCATYGCKKAVPAEKPAPARVTGSGWGDTKTCPNCRRPVGASMLTCRCGARFPYADPMEPQEYRAWVRRQEEARSSRLILLCLFIVTLLGVPAPLTGPIAGAVAWSRRDLLAGADGTYLAMGYGAAALGAVYAVTILLVVLGA